VGIKNLTPYKKGQSGNPKGKPKGTKDGIRARLNALLRKKPTADLKQLLKDSNIKIGNADNAGALAKILISEAFGKNMKAFDLLLEQTEQSLPKPLHVGGPNGEELNPVVVYVPDNGRNK